MKSKSEKSIELYNLLLKKGYDKVFCEVISTELNTDFTATRMLGYLKHYAKLPEADIVDEMLGILGDRQQWIDKKISENTQAKYNQYLYAKDDIMFSDLYLRSIRVEGDLPEDEYFSSIPAIRNLKEMGGLEFNTKVTFLVGENGIGKSTLIEAIAVAMGFNPEGGTKNFNFSTEDSHSELHKYIRASKGIKPAKDGFFLRAESFYNVASNIDQMDREPGGGGKIINSYGGVSLHKQSHGESFLSLVENRFGGHGLYILDEPEAALSPARLLRLLCNIKYLVDNNSQFIIATHSPILMAYPGAEVLQLTEYGIDAVDYKETDHYMITKRFLANPERMCEELFE